jgi:hypothetical protein
MWHQLREGIGTQPVPLELWYMEAARWYYRWLVVAWAVTVIGLLVLGSTWLVKRRPSKESSTPDSPEPPNRVTAS